MKKKVLKQSKKVKLKLSKKKKQIIKEKLISGAKDITKNINVFIFAILLILDIIINITKKD